MVRSIVCFAFVGTCLSSTLQSDIKLESVLEDHGAALEKTYRQLLENVIANPNDQQYAPNSTAMQIANAQFTFLENDLLTQKGENQELIDHANEQVKKCNSNATSFFDAPDTGINALLGKANKARTVHTHCRVEETKKINTYTASKADFDKQNTDGCTKEQDWWASTDTGKGSFQALVVAGKTAHDDKNEKEAQEAQCDKDQSSFEEAFCKYATLLDATCAHFTTCYEAKKESREDIEITVRELETSQKLVWKMVQKIQCYISKIEKAITETPTPEDLKQCTDMIPTAGDLDITYTPMDPPMTCDTNPAANKPGSAGWLTQEFSADTFDNLISSAEKECNIR